jgi:hypothetical protein
LRFQLPFGSLASRLKSLVAPQSMSMRASWPNTLPFSLKSRAFGEPVTAPESSSGGSDATGGVAGGGCKGECECECECECEGECECECDCVCEQSGAMLSGMAT